MNVRVSILGSFFVFCFVCFFSFSAFAEEGKNCEEKKFEVTQKICVESKKQDTAKKLKKLQAKLEAQKARIDRLNQLKQKKKGLKYKIDRLKKMEERSDLNQENVETVKNRLEKLKKKTDQKLAQHRKWKQEHEEQMKQLRSTIEELKQADKKQLEKINELSGMVDDLTEQIKELAAVKDKLYEEVTAMKAKVEKQEKKLKEEFPKIWKAIKCIKDRLPRFSTKLSLDTFAGGAGFTGPMASEQIRWKPDCDVPISVQGEFGLGFGATRGEFPRIAIKGEGGAAFHLIDPEGEGLSLDASINLGYSQAMTMKTDVTEFRFIYVAPRLRVKPFEHFSMFGGGMFGPVYYLKGKDPDFGRGLQIGVSFDY